MTRSTQSLITLDANILRDEQAALQREWLVTNSLGGYASATLAGANTRRYHGLLVAALNPPVGRAVLLSKLEETLEIAGTEGGAQSFALSANLYPGATYPQGYRSLESWAAYPAPTWVWSPAPGVQLEKRVWMARGHNTTYISYRLLESLSGASARLNLVPLLAWKDYHSEMHAGNAGVNATWLPVQDSGDGKAESGALRLMLPGIWRVTAGPLGLDLRLRTDEGAASSGVTFDAKPCWYYRFQHPREQERGLDCEEDLYAPGILSAPLAVGEPLVVIASVEPSPPDAPQTSWNTLVQRQAELVAKGTEGVGYWVLGVGEKQKGRKGEGEKGKTQLPNHPTTQLPNTQHPTPDAEFMSLLALAADQFLVQAPGVRSTIIAGYHWFSDWGRDTMIALPGLCLATGRPELARDILLAFAAHVDRGMLPNRFPDVGETPEYNTVDATLWYFVAIYRYVQATGDINLLRDSLWPVLQEIIRHHQEGTRYNIHADAADNLLYAGEPGVQLTWMDAKVGDWVVTPRIGKPVEINALWHCALRIMAEFATRLGDAETAAHYTEQADKTAASFAQRFPRPDGLGLYDVLDTPDNNAPDAAIRPNQIFALSLPFAAIEPASPVAASILNIVQSELLTDFGLRTLPPSDPAYRPRYEGDQWSRDSAYHQGTVWPWLLGAFAEAHVNTHGDKEAAKAFLRPLQACLTTFGVGSLAEIADADAPHRPNGCIAQAWSVAETLRVWKELQS